MFDTKNTMGKNGELIKSEKKKNRGIRKKIATVSEFHNIVSDGFWRKTIGIRKNKIII